MALVLVRWALALLGFSNRPRLLHCPMAALTWACPYELSVVVAPGPCRLLHICIQALVSIFWVSIFSCFPQRLFVSLLDNQYPHCRRHAQGLLSSLNTRITHPLHSMLLINYLEEHRPLIDKLVGTSVSAFCILYSTDGERTKR